MLLRRAATFLTPTPKTNPDEWAAANRVYPPGTGLPGPRDPYLTAYLVPFCRVVHRGSHRRVVAVTAAQSGKTENMLDVIGARLDQRPAPILYVGPSADFVRDQFEPRLMSLLDEAATLRGKVARGKRMKKTLKTVAGVRVRLGYAGSSTTLKSDPFALGLVDEYDEMVANVRGQGDPLGLAEARGDTYADFVTAVVSTPSQGFVETEIDPVNGLEMWKPGDPDQIVSPIWRLWQEGTRHHFAWPCPHCETFFVPRFKHLKWPKNATPHQAEREAFLLCPRCGGVIEEAHKAEMIAGGVQIAPGQTIEDARDGRGDPENSTWSCWTSGLCSPFQTFGQRASRYLKAFLSGEPDKIQTVMNAAFGECYDIASGGEVPAWEEVLRRRLPYHRGEVPVGGLRLLMAVDVQRMSLFYAIRAFGARGTSWLVDYGQLYGPTEDDQVWNDLADLMMQPQGGLQIERVFVDSGFRPGKKEQVPEHKVYEFARRWSWLVTPTKGKDVMNPPYRVTKIEVKPDGKKAVYSINLAWLSTDFFKSLVVSRLHIPAGQPGAMHLFTTPGLAPGEADPDEDYARQVTSEVRVIENGKPVWVARGANHLFDCEAMLAAAAYTMNVQRIPEGVTRDPAPAEADAEMADAAPAAPAKPSPPPTDARAAMRSKFQRMGARMNR